MSYEPRRVLEGRKMDGLFVGGERTTRADYAKALRLPENATPSIICNEQNRRYFKQKARE